MDLLWGIGGAVVTGTALFVGAPLALSAAGFGAAGIAAGSAAAAWQATIGNVVLGSTFSALQAAGAAGVVSTTTGLAASAAGGLATALAIGR